MIMKNEIGFTKHSLLNHLFHVTFASDDDKIIHAHKLIFCLAGMFFHKKRKSSLV